MREAYLQTVDDLYIELVNCKWYEFRRINGLYKQIEYYNDLIAQCPL